MHIKFQYFQSSAYTYVWCTRSSRHEGTCTPFIDLTPASKPNLTICLTMTRAKPSIRQQVILHTLLTREFLHIRRLARDQRQWHDARDVHLGAVHVHVEVELLADILDVLKTLLVVGAGTTNPNLDVVLDEERRNFPQSANDTLEGRRDVGEVGNTTTDEEDLALGVLGSTEHKVEDGTGVVESLSLGGSTRVLTIVGEFTGETGRGDGVGVDDGSTTTGDKSPHTARGVENGELERSARLCVHLSDVGLLLAHLAAERSGEVQRRADIDSLLAILRRRS
jgi:hypothetical protein